MIDTGTNHLNVDFQGTRSQITFLHHKGVYMRNFCLIFRNKRNILISILLPCLLSCQQINSKTRRTATDNFQFEEITINELQQGYKNRDYTITEVVKAYINRIEAIDKKGPRLNSIIQINPDALNIAAELDRNG